MVAETKNTAAIESLAGERFHLRGGHGLQPEGGGCNENKGEKQTRREVVAWLNKVPSAYPVENLQLADFVSSGAEANLVATVDEKDVCYVWESSILDRPLPGPFLGCPCIRPRCVSWKNFFMPLFQGPNMRYKGMRIG